MAAASPADPAAWQWYDGENLAAKGPVIVTFNYRLGSLGFFAHPELAKESGPQRLRQLRDDGRDRRAAVGEAEHRRVRRRSEQRHRGRRVGRRDHGGRARRFAAGQGAVQPRDRRKRRLDGADDGPHAFVGATPRRTGSRRWTRLASRRSRELRAKPLDELTGLSAGGLVVDGYLIPEDRVVDVHERQAERRRRPHRIEQGRSELRRLRTGRRRGRSRRRRA